MNTNGMNKVAVAAVVGLSALCWRTASAALPTKFRWDDVDGKGTSYTTPVKMQTGSTDRSYAYSMMDYLETMRLIHAGTSYNSLTGQEKVDALGLVELYADNAENRRGAIGDGDGFEVPVMEKSLDWMLRYGYNGHRVVDISFLLESQSSPIGKSINKNEITTLKKWIVEQGPFVVGYKHFDDYVAGAKYCYLPPRNSRLKYEEYNHHRTALIIGYDDSVPASAFSASAIHPDGPGAWIVKGNQGVAYGDNGYYYVSYYDESLLCYNGRLNEFCNYGTGANSGLLRLDELAAKVIDVDWDYKYGNVYCHDASTPCSFWWGTINSGGSSGFVNMFTAQSDDVVNAVGFWLDVPYGGTNILVTAYVGCDEGKPFSGRCMFFQKPLWFPSSGYHAIPLPEPLQFDVKAGQRFSVALEYGSNAAYNSVEPYRPAYAMALQLVDNPARGCSFYWDYSPNRLLDLAEESSNGSDPVLLDPLAGLSTLYHPVSPNMCFITAYTAAEGQIVLTATKGTVDDGIEVRWTTPRSGNGCYDLYRSEANDGNFQYLMTVSSTCFFDSEKMNQTTGRSDGAKPGIRYWYYVKTHVGAKEIESNHDYGFYAPTPPALEVKVAPLWLTGEKPYNTELTWNDYDDKCFEVTKVDFDLTGVDGPAKGMHYHTSISGKPEKIIDLYEKGIQIPKGNNGKHGKYSMNVRWEYVNKITGKAPESNGISQKGKTEGIDVNVYFHKYKQDCKGIGGDLANWFYHWPKDGAIPREFFSDIKYSPSIAYDEKFHYTESIYDKFGMQDNGLGKGQCDPISPSGLYILASPANIGIFKTSFLLVRVDSVSLRYQVSNRGAAIGDTFARGNSRYLGPVSPIGEGSVGVNKLADLIEHETCHGRIQRSLYELGKWYVRHQGNRLSELEIRNAILDLTWLTPTEHPLDYLKYKDYRVTLTDLYDRSSNGESVFIFDSDGDGISDNDERYGKFGFVSDPFDADTYRFSTIRGCEGYSTYGDNEFLARNAESDTRVQTFPENDWAFPGSGIAQQHQKYQDIDLEAEGAYSGQDYRYWEADREIVMDMLQKIDGDKDYDNMNWDLRFKERRAMSIANKSCFVSTVPITRSHRLLLNAVPESVFDGAARASGGLPSNYAGIDGEVDTITNVMSVVSVGDGIGCHPDDGGRNAALGFQIALTNYTSDVQDCIVSGNLFDSNGVAVAWAQMRVELEGNSAAAADLLFDGRYLYESRSGGFVLRDVAVQPIGIDVMPYYDVTNANVAAGADCVYTAFTPHDGYVFPESIAETIDERGISLDVDVEIHGDEPLTLMATLNGTNGMHVAQTVVTNLLWSGVQRATVTFSADQLYYSKVDGPYEIGVFQLLKGNEAIWNGGVNHRTASCEYKQFARADRPFTLSNDMPLTMEDKDGGDWLIDEVDVSFDVSCATSEPLGYRAKMLVLTTNDEFVCTASADVVLTNGNNRVTIPVTGEALFTSGKEGPYLVRQVIMDPMEKDGFRDRALLEDVFLSFCGDGIHALWTGFSDSELHPVYVYDVGPYPFALNGEPMLMPQVRGSEPCILVPLDIRRTGMVTASATVWTKAGEFVGALSASNRFYEVGNSVLPVEISVKNGVKLQAGGEYVVRGLVLTSEYERFAPLKCQGSIISFRQKYSYVNFASGQIAANEGDNTEVVLTGGSLSAATSVDLNLIHNTTVAADLDLTKAMVDGVTVKNLKFPYTVKWAKGEVAEKRISIPVKADTTIEGWEMLTLQLGNAKGMELGDARVCTVKIRDMNSDITIAQGLRNESLRPSMSGAGKWTAHEAAHYDPDDGYKVFVQSPNLKAGQTTKLDIGTFYGSGQLQFSLKFVGDDSGSAASTFYLYHNTSRYGVVDQIGNGDGWHGWKATFSSSGAHHFVLEFVQGSNPDVHVRLSSVLWVPDDEEVYQLFIMDFSNDMTSLVADAGYSSGAGVYKYGTKVTLTGNPRPGYEFAYWNSPDNKNIYQPKITTVVTNSAIWFTMYKKIPYVRALADPADGGKVSGSGLCENGKKVTLKAAANKNFTFVGWTTNAARSVIAPYQDGDFVATTATLVADRSTKPTANSKTSTTITNLTGDVTYYAVFKSDPKVTVFVEATDGKGDAPTGKGAGKYVAGTITGEGKYPPGKTKIALKSAANKNYVFSGWYEASGKLLTKDATCTIAAMPSNDVEYVAKFITTDDDKMSIDAVVDGWTLEPWVSKAETHAFATNIWAGVYLEWPVTASALSDAKVKVAGLPAGLKFTDKPVTTKIGTGKAAVTVTNVLANTIYGAPTAASKIDAKTKSAKPSEVKLTVTTAGKSSQTYQIDTVVDALPTWAQGTFAGGWEPEDAATSGGQVSLTVDAKGKVSGKALGEGLTYTLSAPYYSAFALDENQASNFLADVTASWSYKEGTKTIKTNEVVQLVVQDNIIGGYAAVEDWFDAYTANWKVEPWKALGKSFDKQTMVYAILADGTLSDDENYDTVALGEEVTGRVTLKFAATGAVTIAGEFVSGAYNDKTKKYPTVKATGSATLVPVDEEHGAVFIYLTPKGLPPHTRCVEVPWPEE